MNGRASAEKTALDIVRPVADLRTIVDGWRAAGSSLIAVVPTMGALHEGHMALIRAAVADCDRVIVSIFVNPAQFNDEADLNKYPRREKADADCAKACGAHLIYAPTVMDMYPDGFQTNVAITGLTRAMEGPARPGHFDGVATVVAKLMLQTTADRAYFGEKDFQQLRVVTQMAADLNIRCQVTAVPTVRAADGLALSSRNERLSDDQRQIAPALYNVLQELAALLPANATSSAGGRGVDAQPHLDHAMQALIAAGFDRVDYIILCDARTLMPIDQVTAGQSARLCAAAWLGDVRLIDNVAV